MSQFLSDKIKLISFFAIILVLYIHSGFHQLPHEIEGMPFNYYLQELISGVLGRCAVPLFFAISGYLYFLNVNNLHDVYRKMKKRMKSLLIPYLIAALFLPFFYLIMEHVPIAAGQFINSNDFGQNFTGNIFQILYRLYIDSGKGSPLGFHLWYLRDLIGIVMLSPFLFKIKDVVNPILLVVVIYLLTLIPNINFFTSLFWFTFGSLFLNKLNVTGGGQFSTDYCCLLVSWYSRVDDAFNHMVLFPSAHYRLRGYRFLECV